MKKIYLFILFFVLLLPVTSSFAAPSTGTGQQIIIPYTQIGDGWWSGLAINNTFTSSMTFTVAVYRESGIYAIGSSFAVAAHAMKVDVLENFFSGTPPSGRMLVRIRTTTNQPFQATLFVGNTEGGFGFQNYTSEEYTYPVL